MCVSQTQPSLAKTICRAEWVSHLRVLDSFKHGRTIDQVFRESDKILTEKIF